MIFTETRSNFIKITARSHWKLLKSGDKPWLVTLAIIAFSPLWTYLKKGKRKKKSTTDKGIVIGNICRINSLKKVVENISLKEINNSSSCSLLGNKGERTHPHKQGQAEMTFYVSPKVLGKIMHQILFINTSGFLPFVLFMSPDPLPQILRKQAVRHPLFCISLLNSHFLQSSGCGL